MWQVVVVVTGGPLHHNSDMRFGALLSRLMRDLGVTAVALGDLTEVNAKTVRRWQLRDRPPHGDAIVLIADALAIPLPVFRAAVEGKAPIPAQYRDRAKWKSRHASTDSSGHRLGPTESRRVMAWFLSSPPAAQVAILNNVPSGTEEKYARALEQLAARVRKRRR